MSFYKLKLESKWEQSIGAFDDRRCAISAHNQANRGALATLHIENHLATSTARIALAL